MTGLPLIDERPGTDSTSRPDDTSRAAPCQGGAACVACSADDADDALAARARSPVTRRLAALLFGLVAASPAAAQAPDDATRLEPVVVTVTRMEQKAGDAPASVTVLTRDDIQHSASQTVDDLLRQVPGFSLFRRSSSLVTHPTTQGLSLRGIGPSGTSRALVLVDGVTANDPFGGWVYWGRIPMLGIEQIEVVRGGGSSAWGNYALGGVVQILTRRPTERALFFDASYGTRETMNFDLLLHDVEGPFRISLEGNYFSTGGGDLRKRGRPGSLAFPSRWYDLTVIALVG